MQHITASDIDAMEQRYRAHFINGLSGYKSANLIGTQDTQGNTNLAIVSSVFHLGANPPLMGMIVRPHSVPRHTLENLLATGCYSINHVTEAIYQAAHQTSARYPQSTSEFAACGLTPHEIPDFAAPLVQESPIQMGLELVSTQTLVNGTELVIGEIKHIVIQKQAIQSDGFIDIEQLGTVALSSLDSYHSAKRLNRLSYAKPDKTPEAIALNGEPLTD